MKMQNILAKLTNTGRRKTLKTMVLQTKMQKASWKGTKSQSGPPKGKRLNVSGKEKEKEHADMKINANLTMRLCQVKVRGLKRQMRKTWIKDLQSWTKIERI